MHREALINPMKHYKLVLPEFMNEQGALFGGYLLKWIDELAYITASLEHPGNRFVTISLDGMEFRKPIAVGYMLCFDITETRLGNTSIAYSIKVFNAKIDRDGKDLLFQTNIVFVNVDENGNKQRISR